MSVEFSMEEAESGGSFWTDAAAGVGILGQLAEIGTGIYAARNRPTIPPPPTGAAPTGQTQTGAAGRGLGVSTAVVVGAVVVGVLVLGVAVVAMR